MYFVFLNSFSDVMYFGQSSISYIPRLDHYTERRRFHIPFFQLCLVSGSLTLTSYFAVSTSETI